MDTKDALYLKSAASRTDIYYDGIRVTSVLIIAEEDENLEDNLTAAGELCPGSALLSNGAWVALLGAELEDFYRRVPLSRTSFQQEAKHGDG